MVWRFGEMWEVCINVPSMDAYCCVIPAEQISVWLAEDADEIRHPLLVPISG